MSKTKKTEFFFQLGKKAKRLLEKKGQKKKVKEYAIELMILLHLEFYKLFY